MPKRYYLSEIGHFSKDDPLRKSATISAGHALDVPVEVAEAGSVIWYCVLLVCNIGDSE